MNADLFLPGTIRKALSEKSTRSFGSSTTNNWWLISRMFLRSAGGREARDLKTVWSKSHSFRRASQQGLPGGGHARLQEAASMVVCQAQSGMAGDHAVSESHSTCSAWTCLSYQADEQFPVGAIVILSPRAGCLK